MYLEGSQRSNMLGTFKRNAVLLPYKYSNRFTMAHAIIFTDRAPVTRMFDDIKFTSAFYSYPAGAYKIASVLREQGLDVLVVPNCLSLSFAGVKHIIEQNSNNLLWVGISTTFLTIDSSHIQVYRDLWTTTDKHYVDTDIMFDKVDSYGGVQELAWFTKEIGRISFWLDRNYHVPLVLGGSWVTRVKDGNLTHLHQNTQIVKGYAETWTLEFTKQQLSNKNQVARLEIDNHTYDDVDFKSSKIHWDKTDFISPNDWLPLEVARGCAFSCHYCDYPRRSNFDSYKNAEALKQELVRNYEEFGVTRYLLVDDLYNDSRDKVRILYDKVWSQLPFKPEWASYMRLDMFWADPESIEIVRESGARIGSFGIETLHDRAGKGVGKGLGRERILQTLTNLKQSWGDQVLVCANFIAGLPLEPLDSIKETMAWCLETDLLYSYAWNPMNISNSARIEIASDKKYLHKITQNNHKYEIKWLTHDNWVNSQGVTWEQADQLVMDHMSKVPHGIKVNFTDYVDLRMSGLDHNDIVGLKSGATQRVKLITAVDTIRSRIRSRLESVVNTKI
jgi:hypothetical protein